MDVYLELLTTLLNGSEGPFEVVSRTDKAMIIRSDDGSEHHVAIDNVKPARLDPDEPTTSSTKRKVGRPRKGTEQ